MSITRTCPKCKIIFSGVAGIRVYCPNCERYYGVDELLCRHYRKKGDCPDRGCDFERKR